MSEEGLAVPNLALTHARRTAAVARQACFGLMHAGFSDEQCNAALDAYARATIEVAAQIAESYDDEGTHTAEAIAAGIRRAGY